MTKCSKLSNYFVKITSVILTCAMGAALRRKNKARLFFVFEKKYCIIKEARKESGLAELVVCRLMEQKVKGLDPPHADKHLF
jgi:hypothetical protein